MPENAVTEILATARAEMDRSMFHYRSGDFARGKRFERIIIADDGLATGLTASAAIESVKITYRPSELIFAVHVAATESLLTVQKLVHEVVCLRSENNFYSVGRWYEEFEQIAESEVLATLEECDRFWRKSQELRMKKSA